MPSWGLIVRCCDHESRGRDNVGRQREGLKGTQTPQPRCFDPVVAKPTPWLRPRADVEDQKEIGLAVGQDRRTRIRRAARRPPANDQPASSSRRSVSAVAPTPYLAELARRRHLTIAADLTGGRSIVPPRTGLGEKELATSVGSRSAAPTPGAGRSAAELSVSAVACPMRRLFAGRTERPTRGQRSPR
jgi:hypothetical protein